MALGTHIAGIVLVAASCWSCALADLRRQAPFRRVRPGADIVQSQSVKSSVEPIQYSPRRRAELRPADIALVMRLNQGNAKYQRQGCDMVANKVPFLNEREVRVLKQQIMQQSASQSQDNANEMRATSVSNFETETNFDNQEEDPATPAPFDAPLPAGAQDPTLSDGLRASPETFAESLDTKEKAAALVRADPADIKAIQQAVIDSEVPTLAIQAMNKFPDDLELQLACTKMVTSLAAWNRHAAAQLGTAGAVRAVVQAMRTFRNEPNMQLLVGSMSHFNDLNINNRETMQRMGVVQELYAMKEANPQDTILEVNMQRMLSTLCLHPYAMKEMLTHQYIRQSVTAMQQFPSLPGHRGEVMEAFRNCFLFNPSSLQAMLDAGILPELMTNLGPESSIEKLDMLGPVRLQYNTLLVLSALTQYKPRVAANLIENGVLKRFGDVLLAQDHIAKNFLDYDVTKATCQAVLSLFGIDGEGSHMIGHDPSRGHLNDGSQQASVLNSSGIMDTLARKVSAAPKDLDLQDTCRPLLRAWYREPRGGRR